MQQTFKLPVVRSSVDLKKWTHEDGVKLCEKGREEIHEYNDSGQSKGLIENTLSSIKQK